MDNFSFIFIQKYKDYIEYIPKLEKNYYGPVPKEGKLHSF